MFVIAPEKESDKCLCRDDHTVFDAVYVPAQTPLLREAARRGARVVPGLGMLARQGARALEAWSGRRPDEQKMIATLKRLLKQE